MEETDGESGISRKLTLKKGAKAENNNIGLVYTNKTKLSRKLMTSRLSQITTKTIGQFKDKNEHILYQSWEYVFLKQVNKKTKVICLKLLSGLTKIKNPGSRHLGIVRQSPVYSVWEKRQNVPKSDGPPIPLTHIIGQQQTIIYTAALRGHVKKYLSRSHDIGTRSHDIIISFPRHKISCPRHKISCPQHDYLVPTT